MTDQEKLSAPLTPADAPANPATGSGLQIREVTNGRGDFIQDGGISYDSNLTISGSASPREYVEIWDWGQPVTSAYADLQGLFIAKLPDQLRGPHLYTATNVGGVISPPWTVIVEGVTAPVIESVYGPDGEPINDGERTFHNELNFIGLGVPGRRVDLLNNGKVIKLLNIDPNGHWSARLEDLKPGTQVFVARDLTGLESPAWRVVVTKPSVLAIKFVIGQEQFQEIDNQGVTTDRAVTVVGTGIPHETGWIVDYNNNLVPFAVDEHGVYSATIRDLAVNHVHTLRCKSETGRLSAPWAIRVVSSKL
ncbi:hypothetical protein NF673_13610 [Pseudomonas moraviensis]|uniref:hypothetical protein n=1 Tax=Pseudomonas moraviensis TaxID=321662 RepID=UPI002092E02D|nr:hypothetical protein [Pseudomonas moraviensis]UST61690.1 hypothetical protein NF673_13610 [Pseudomonas moraviensis]